MNWKSARERKRRLKRICERNGHAWYSEEKGRYIRYYMSNGDGCGARRFFKKYSNKMIRKHLKKSDEETMPREKSYFKNGAYIDSWEIDDW